jgi:hypothetical protein
LYHKTVNPKKLVTVKQQSYGAFDLKKAIVVGAVLSLIGTALIIAAVYMAVQAGNYLNTNDAVAVHNFVALLTNQVGPIFFVGIGLLGAGLVILAVKFLLWTRLTPKEQV